MSKATLSRPDSRSPAPPGQGGPDEARYERFFELLRGPATAMVRRAFGSIFSDEELDDLYSSAWLSTIAALRRKPRRLSDEELRRYLLTAVANQASREIRRRGRKPTMPIEVAAGVVAGTQTPDEAVAQAEESGLARDVIVSLPPRRRAVMMLRYGWGLDPSEVRALVDGLSARAYRKEVERGVAEVARKMRMAEDGTWCTSREPLLRSYAAGVASDDERRQAQQHLSHCRHCADFVGKLGGHLHELGGVIVASATAEGLGPEGGLLTDRVVAVVERMKQTVGSALGRGSEVADQAAGQLAASGGTRGAGVAGAGALAKLAGVGAVPKIVAACVGTGAAATACVAAGIAPVGGFDGDRTSPGAAKERPAPRERSDGKRHAGLAIEVAPVAEGSDGGSDKPAATPAKARPAPAAAAPAPAQETPQATVAAPTPTAQEFEPVGTPVGGRTSASTSPSSGGGGSGGDAGGGSSSGDFGP